MNVDKSLFCSKDAAKYLEYSLDSVRQSRRTGMLARRAAPKHTQVGGRVFYTLEALDEWLDTFLL